MVRSRDTAYLTEQTPAFRRQRETTNVAAWVNAAFETERATRGHRRAFVPYADLVGDWRAAMMRAGEQLAISYDGDLSRPHPVDDFVDQRLNRSQVTWDDLEVAPRLRDLAERTWAAMNTLVTTPHDPAAVAELEELRAAYVELYEFAAALALDETTAQVGRVRRNLNRKLANRDKRIARLEERLRGR